MKLTYERLTELLNYDPETGVFTWKTGWRKGTVAGPSKNNYPTIGIDGRAYYAHRLAWFFFYKEWPEKSKVIDHKNNIKSDNRISNLRVLTQSQNIYASRDPRRAGMAFYRNGVAE